MCFPLNTQFCVIWITAVTACVKQPLQTTLSQSNWLILTPQIPCSRPGPHRVFEGACCFKTPVSVSLNRLSSPSPPFLCLFHPSHFLSLVSSRQVTVMIHGRCGTRTPRGAPTTTGRPTQRAPRLGRLLLTPGVPHPRAIRRLIRAQVRKSFDCLMITKYVPEQ